VLSLLRESASALALHDSNDDRQLDFAEFAAFMGRFMSAAGYKLEQVLDELLLLAATKVRAAEPDARSRQHTLCLWCLQVEAGRQCVTAGTGYLG
jgi:uncharacterized protein with von Willebrand factor type A (vWA) domain